MVCALQNGVEQVERVGPLCPSSQVVPAVVWFSAEPHPEGWIRLRTGAAGTARRPTPQRGSPICCAAAGMTVELDPDFITAAWRKLLVNALADFMVLTGRRSGMFRRDDVAALCRRYLAECLAVARAEGANLGDDVIDEIVGLFGKAPEDMTTSMLTDREAHRRLEWDIRNGVISRKARRHMGWPRRSATWWCPCWPRQATDPDNRREATRDIVLRRQLSHGARKRRMEAGARPSAVSKHAAGRRFCDAAEHRADGSSSPNTSK